MSDDTQTNVSDSTDFADSLELEAPDTGNTDETPEAPAEPATQEEAQPVEKPAEPEVPETEAEEPKPADETKGMTRAERAEHYQNLERQTRKEVDQAYRGYQPAKTLEDYKNEYLDQGLTDGEALIAARMDVADDRAKIAEEKSDLSQFNADIRVDSFEAQSTFDWMNKSKPDSYDKESHALAAELFSAGAEVDPNTGQVLSAIFSPMQAAQIIDKARNSGMTKAQIKGQKAAEAQMAAVAPSSSSAPVVSRNAEEKQADALANAFNDL